MVNNAAGADLRATKMLIDMMKDIERKVGVAAPPEPRRFAPADEQVIKHLLERIRGALLQEIQDMNLGNPALAMVSLPPAEPVSVLVRHPCRLTVRFDRARRVRRLARPLAVSATFGGREEEWRQPRAGESSLWSARHAAWCFLPGRSRRRRRT
jgi:hypothetical protein